MPSLDDLKKRIKSVKSTQKITKAMKMVAAAKLRKAQESAEKGRPYSQKMQNIILNLTKSINDPQNAPKLLVGTGEDRKYLCVVLTADRGLCGGDVAGMTDFAHANGMLAIGVVNPLAMSVITPPGQWGETGADIVVGEGQPLGAPLSSGGPYFGFMCCTQALVRQMPGRIIGKTTDLDGKDGYALTLQAREQHIRRSKATSNICTNQGLLVTAATIHMSLLGAEGLARAAASSHHNTNSLVEQLTAINGVEQVFSGAAFHERVLRLPAEAEATLQLLANQDVLGGFNLKDDYPELGDAILVCATEQRTEDEIAEYASKLAKVVGA